MNACSFMFLTQIFMLVLIFLSQMIALATTRKTLLFGVRVPEGEKRSKEAKKITGMFIFLNFILTAVLITVCCLTSTSDIRIETIKIVAFSVIVLLISMLIYILCWKKAKALKAKNNWTIEYAVSVDTSFDDTLKKKLKGTLWWYFISLIIIAASFIISALHLKSAPDMLPTHWGPDGTADAFGKNSITTLLPMLLTGIGLIAVMYFTAFISSRSKLQKGGKYGNVTAQQGVKYKTIMMNYAGYISVVMSVLLGLTLMLTSTLIPQPTNPAPFAIATVLMLALMVIPIFVIMIKAGQSGEKLKVDDDYIENTVHSITTINDDIYWKCGLFYFNRNDPALLVESRFGSNTDFNYSKPVAWVVVCLTLLIIAGAIAAILFVA